MPRSRLKLELDGHPGELKERTLGIEEFGVDPDYDTNLDPVVRTTAAEIRKRLAQYYLDPSHEAEPVSICPWAPTPQDFKYRPESPPQGHEGTPLMQVYLDMRLQPVKQERLETELAK